ncbi:Urb2/Npa2 family-domain-containing protein [Kockovaella imperatae]|uniref:Urb2/Npa2 family-domain-containing protein n=1 Tax=Kockovaella imperatae TaxID=4999 RepID=A0A1Y1URW5_9TREE|nr:Urb2/Npa2 family-domain-containing protein [Kockovaella imperatae]ORX40781.1 Urb2/Npa2 family-domain-containing protein [Kockovaella imperatae]
MSSSNGSREYLVSASSLIKALKAPSDPPHPDWPSKIDIALQAWEDQALHLPRKAEVLRDWVLDVLLRPASKSHTPHASFLAKYYDLLYLTCLDSPLGTPLPLSIFAKFFQALVTEPKDSHELLLSAAKTFELLYSGLHQVKMDAWVEVWKTSLAYLASSGSVYAGSDVALRGLYDLVVKLWRPDELIGDTQVKKTTLQLYEHFPALIKAQALHPDIDSLRRNQMFLPVPILRDYDPLQPILHQLQNIALDAASFAATSFLPRLLHDFIHALSTNKYQIFTQPSSSKQSFDVYVSEKLRSSVQSGFKSISDNVDRICARQGVSQTDLWASKLALWTEISLWGGYLESDEAWAVLLRNEAARAVATLRGDQSDQTTDPKSRQAILQLLNVLENLDHGHSAIDAETVAWCLAAPKFCSAEAEKLLSSLLRYHQLTFSLPAFFTLLREAILSLFPGSLDVSVTRQIYDLLKSGALLSDSLQSLVRSSLTALTGPSVRKEIWSSLSYSTVGTETRGKRKQKERADHEAAFLALSVQLAILVLPSGCPLEDDDSYNQGAAALLSQLDEADPASSDSNESKKRKARKSDTLDSATQWTGDILLAAKLRLSQTLELVDRAWIGDRPLAHTLLKRLQDASALAETKTAILSSLSQSLLIQTQDRYGLESSDITAFIDLWLGLLEEDTQAQECVASAAWNLLWKEGIFTFEMCANPEQKQHLLDMIGSHLWCCKQRENFPPRTSEILLTRTRIWELPGIRGALLAILEQSVTSGMLEMGTLFILLHVPPTVISRNLKEELVKLQMNRLLSEEYYDETFTTLSIQWLATLALDVFQLRIIVRQRQRVGLHLQDTRIIPRLVSRGGLQLESAPAQLLTSMLKYVWSLVANRPDQICRHALRSGGSDKDILETLDLLTTCLSDLKSPCQIDAPVETLTIVLRCLHSAQTSVLLSPEVEERMRTLVKKAKKQLGKSLPGLLRDLKPSEVSIGISAIQLWKILLQSSRHLQLRAPGVKLSRDLLALYARLKLPSLASSIIEIAHDEAGDYEEDILVFVTLVNAIRPCSEASNAFATIMRKATLEDFTSALEASLAAQSADTPHSDPGTYMTSAHLSTIQTLVGIPLEGSGKVMRKLCMPLLDEIARVVSTGSVQDCIAGIRCLDQLLQARSRILRSLDFATVCHILITTLHPTPGSVRATRSLYEMFDSVLSSLGSVVRLRPDLITEHGPEIVGVISSMFVLFLEIRRQHASSPRIRARLMSRWPSWLAEPSSIRSEMSANHRSGGGLQACHASQLARLLTMLCNAKVDNAGTSQLGRTTIANSLLKHVPTILVSYCRAVADSWGMIPLDVRKELEPGLWSLCDILTAGGRVDARGREGERLGLPYGLGDTGEVEKDVWAEMWLSWSFALGREEPADDIVHPGDYGETGPPPYIYSLQGFYSRAVQDEFRPQYRERVGSNRSRGAF